MKHVVVLGAGMVGSAIALDLGARYRVTAVDVDSRVLSKIRKTGRIETATADLSDCGAVRDVVQSADLVVGAVPGFMGFETLKTVIEAGKNVVDISFFPEDPFSLAEAAKQNDVTAIVDCGVAPGMSNIILGYYNKRMKVQTFDCYVGGFPVKRVWPYQYKAPFSPIDVVEEYIRPARLVVDGKVVVRPALSDAEYLEFDHIGTLEAFNTDGLRTLIDTVSVPNMREKTMRYPGHIDYIRVLRESGFFGKDPIEVGDVTVRPIDVTARLLFPRWHLEENEVELTVMRVIVRGEECGVARIIVYDLFDRYDETTAISSMARTTGYTCCAAVELVLAGVFNRKGICPPEYIGGEEGCFEAVLEYLRARNVCYTVREEQPETAGSN